MDRLPQKFKGQMALHHRDLSVELMTKHANDVTLKDVTLETLDNFGIKLPVPKKTAWKWTRKSGGVSGTCEKHHHDDKHQDPETIKCRANCTATLKRLEKRRLAWAEIDAAEETRLSALKGGHSNAGLLLDSGVRLHHQDDFDSFVTLPKRTRPDFKLGLKPSVEDWKREWSHACSACECHLVLNHHGQDESACGAFQLSNRIWIIDGVRGSRKKGDGPGEMVGACTDDFLGFGLALTPDQLAAFNVWRRQERGTDTTDLTRSPGRRLAPCCVQTTSRALQSAGRA
jgi:hypothetical protein